MDTVIIRITAKEDNRRRFAVIFMGVKVAVAFDRDSGAKVAYGARLISGTIGSGGSRANWYCKVAKGSVFEIEVDREAFERNKNRIKKWDMDVIENFSMTEDRSRMLHEASEDLE